MYTVWCASLLLVCVLATTFGDFHGGGVDARRHRRSMLSVRGVADTDGPVVVEKKVLVDADDEEDAPVLPLDDQVVGQLRAHTLEDGFEARCERR